MEPRPRLRRRVQRLRGLVEEAAVVVRRLDDTLPGRSVALFRRIEGRDRVLMLAGQAFIAVFPLMIVVATIRTSRDGLQVGDWVVREFGLTGSTATAVSLLFGRPPGQAGGITVASVLVLLWTFTSFARSLQQTFEAAWDLPRRGWHGATWSLGAIGAFAVTPALSGWIGSLRGTAIAPDVAVVLAQAVVVITGWAAVSYLMLSGRVPFTTMLPGAAASAVVQLLIGWWTALYVPNLISRNAARYGVIGVAMGLISWLIIVSAGIVCSAVAGPVLHEEWERVRRRFSVRLPG